MRWAIKHKSGRTLFVTSDEFIANNRRKMGWIVEEVMSECPKCNGTGMADSGGVQPWGEPILIECDCVMEVANMTSREQFEEWLYQQRVRGINFNIDKFDVDGGVYYKSPDIQGQWNAWQASRAAVEVELPEEESIGCPTGYYAADVVEAIESAGIKVKK